MSIECVTYGCGNEFQAEKFDTATVWPGREYFAKPKGGLWGSPVDAEYGWKEWCESADFREFTEADSFHWIASGRIFWIDSYRDCLKLPWNDPPSEGFWSAHSRGIDWEELKKVCDVVYLTERGEQETRYTSDVTLYGYDCECVLALNESAIHPL